MNVYVPRRDGFNAADEKVRVASMSVYNTGIVCGALMLAIITIALQLEQHSKCKGISHQDKIGMSRLMDDINR